MRIVLNIRACNAKLYGSARWFVGTPNRVPSSRSSAHQHKDSPRTDFKQGDVMGGVVLRILMK